MGQLLATAQGGYQYAIAYDLQTTEQSRQAWNQFWQQVTDGGAQMLRDFVTRDLPIVLATSVLSGGTAAAGAALFRVATGVRLARRVVLAMKLAA